MKKVRESNIELLRIFAMLGVVLLHYNNKDMGGGFKYVADGSANQIILLLLEGLFICAVDLFMLITGYFSCTSPRAEPTKAAALLLQVVVFRVLAYGWDILKGAAFSVSGLVYAMLPMNYFVVLYVAVYLVSPYINQMLWKLSKSQMKALLVLALMLFSFWPTLLDAATVHTGKQFAGMNTVGTNGSGQGHTFVNFMVMYLVGAYLRLADIRLKKRYSAAAVVALTVILALAGKYAPFNRYAWAYCNPLVIAQAAAVFLLFREISLKSRAVNFLAKGSFTCYLFHTFFLGHYRIAEAVGKSPLYLVGHVIFTAATIYLICFVAYLAYDFLSKPILRLVEKLFQKLGLHIFVDNIDLREF